MRSFKDTFDREWQLSLNVHLLKKVKEQTGVLLTEVADKNCELLIRLHEDLALLVDVLWCLCEKQAPSLGVVDDEQLQATEKFAEGLGGDSLANAATALVGAVADFFPNQDQRKALTALIQKVNQTGKVVGEMLTARIESFDPNLLDETTIASALNLPPSPESTPGSTPLAS